MKRTAVLLLALALLSAPAMADPGKAKKAAKTTTTIRIEGSADGPMGVGLFLGQPAGLDFEMDLSRDSWLDFKAAWSLMGGQGGFSILVQGNYEYAFPGALVIEGEDFTPFVGGGAIVDITSGGVGIGARVPAGVSYRFAKVPLELFLEVGLDIYLFPATAIGGSGGLGVRYRF